jgi:hypothetical protein
VVWWCEWCGGVSGVSGVGVGLWMVPVDSFCANFGNTLHHVFFADGGGYFAVSLGDKCFLKKFMVGAQGGRTEKKIGRKENKKVY